MIFLLNLGKIRIEISKIFLNYIFSHYQIIEQKMLLLRKLAYNASKAVYPLVTFP
jgi:hypothetical protein